MEIKFRRTISRIEPDWMHPYASSGWWREFTLATVLVAEVSPSRRTIAYCRRGDIGIGGRMLLPFPYVQFVLTYPTGRFQYTSVYSRALQVYFTTEPLRLESDFKLSYSPLETIFGGAACLGHQYDGKMCRTEQELIEFAVGTWWTSGHFRYSHHLPNDMIRVKESWSRLPDPLTPGVWDDPKLWPCPGFRTLKSAVYGLSPGRIEDE